MSLLKSGQVAAMLGCSKSTALNLAKAGKFVSVIVGKQARYTKESVQAYLNGVDVTDAVKDNGHEPSGEIEKSSPSIQAEIDRQWAEFEDEKAKRRQEFEEERAQLRQEIGDKQADIDSRNEKLNQDKVDFKTYVKETMDGLKARDAELDAREATINVRISQLAVRERAVEGKEQPIIKEGVDKIFLVLVGVICIVIGVGVATLTNYLMFSV